jgi:hypothetical protein
MSLFDVKVHLDVLRDVISTAESHDPPEQVGHRIRAMLPELRESYAFLSMEKYALGTEHERLMRHANQKRTFVED